MKSLISTLLIALSTVASAATEKYRVMFNENASSQATIGWNQGVGVDPVVYYDTINHGQEVSAYAFSQGPDKISVYKGMNNHFVRLKDLKPNTAYYFIIVDSEGSSPLMWFETVPAGREERLSFIAGGDSRNNREPRQNANRIVSKLHADAVLFGGDMTNIDTDQEWDEWFDDWQLTISPSGRITPIVAARGNHEQSNLSVSELFDTPADVYFAVDFGTMIRTYTLNSEISIAGNQTNWLANDLASSTHVAWKSAQYHKPMRPHQSGKSEGNDQYNYWAQLFQDHEVKLVVECDAHVVKTTWPVVPDPNGEQGFVRDDENGVVYIGEGCWGAPTRANDDDKSWTRASGTFNQVKWIFVDEFKIEARTIQVDNAQSVGAIDPNNRFTAPDQLAIWQPENGTDPVVVIQKPTHPVAQIISPVSPFFMGSPQSLNIQAQASDINGNVQSVSFYVNDTWIGADAAAPFEMEYDFDRPGSYLVHAVALDDEGKTGTSALVKVDVGSTSQSVQKSISLGNHDAEETSSGLVILDETQLELGEKLAAGNQWLGLYFENMNIPAGAIIESAHLQFTAAEPSFGLSNLQIKAEKSIASEPFQSEAYNLSMRNMTASTALWEPSSWLVSDEQGEQQKSSDLALIIQELVDQKGWSRNSAIGLLVSGSGTRNAVAFEQDPSSAAQLVVAYSYTSEAAELTWLSPDPELIINHYENNSFQLECSLNPEQIEKIEIYSNGQHLLDLPKGSLQFDHAFQQSGSYYLQAKVIDTERSISYSDSVLYRVNLAPQITHYSPIQGHFQRPEDVLLSLEAEDPENALVGVEFFLDEVLVYQTESAPFTFIPQVDEGGLYHWSARATDDLGQSHVVQGQFTLNHKPQATEDEFVVDYNAWKNLKVLNNDLDLDGDDLEVFLVNAPVEGRVEVVNQKSFNYYSASNFEGLDYFQYASCDGFRCDTTTVIVSVERANQKPVALDDYVSTLEGANLEIEVLLNDVDADGDPLTTSIRVAPSNGELTALGEGHYLYQPQPGFNGQDDFTYRVCDQEACDEAVVYIQVTPVNEAPRALADQAHGEEDLPVLAQVLANDFDPDGDVLSLEILSMSLGEAKVIDNGTVEVIPPADYYGIIEVFYSVCDAEFCDTASLEALFAPVDDSPRAEMDSFTLLEDQGQVLPVELNDTEVDGDLSYLSIARAPVLGQAIINAQGKLEYIPQANVSGMDELEYWFCDEFSCDRATVRIEIVPVNDAPVVVNESLKMLEDESLSFMPLANDSDIENQSLSFSLEGTVQQGTAFVDGDNITFIPDANFFGEVVLNYLVCDGQLCSQGQAFIEVQAINDLPVLVAQNLQVLEDESNSINLAQLASDADGDALSFNLLESPAKGEAQLSMGVLTYMPEPNFYGQDILWVQTCDALDCISSPVYVEIVPVNDAPLALADFYTLNEDAAKVISPLSNDIDPEGQALSLTWINVPATHSMSNLGQGSYLFTPGNHFNGSLEMQYQVCDSEGACSFGEVSFEVVPVNDAPQASDDYIAVEELSKTLIPVLLNDRDEEGDLLSIRVIQEPIQGNVTVVGQQLEFTAGMSQSQPIEIRYEVCDQEACSQATVFVAVNDINQAPIAQDDQYTLLEDQVGSLTVLSNDQDLDGDALSIQVISSSEHASINVLGQIIQLIPEADYFGWIQFDYQVCDSWSCDTAKVWVEVLSVNDAPVGQIFTPYQNQQFAPGESITLSISGSDDGFISQVSYFINQQLVATIGSTEGFAYDWTTLGAGNYSLYAELLDNEGKSSLTPTVSFSVIPSLGLEEAKQAVEAFPNPFLDQLKLRLPANQTIAFQLVNAYGQVVYQSEAKGPITSMDLGFLSPGLYQLVYKNAKDEFHRIPIVKN